MRDVEQLVSAMKHLMEDDEIVEDKRIFEMRNEELRAEIYRKTSYMYRIKFQLKICDDEEFTNIEILLTEEEAILLNQWGNYITPISVEKDDCSTIKEFLKRNKDQAHVPKFEKYFSEIFSQFFKGNENNYFFPSISIDFYHFWAMKKYCHIFTFLGCSIPDIQVITKAVHQCFRRSLSSCIASNYRSSEFDFFMLLKKLGCKFLAELGNSSKSSCLLEIIIRFWRRKIIKWRKFSLTTEKIVEGEQFEKKETAITILQYLLDYLSDVNHYYSTNAEEILRIFLLLLNKVILRYKSNVTSCLLMKCCVVQHCIISRHFLLFLANILGIKRGINICHFVAGNANNDNDDWENFLDFLVHRTEQKTRLRKEKKKQYQQPHTLQQVTCKEINSVLQKNKFRNLFTVEKLEKMHYPMYLKALIIENNQFSPTKTVRKEEIKCEESNTIKDDSIFFSCETVLKSLVLEWAIKNSDKLSCEKLVKYMQSNLLK